MPSPEHPTQAKHPLESTSDAPAHQQSDLAARVALLESRLGVLDAESAFSLFASLPVPEDPTASTTHPQLGPRPAIQGLGQASKSDFLELPEPSMFEALIDIYFDRCHNQPYVYFHEEMFRADYQSGRLPQYLLFAFAATACRFYDHDFYRDRRTEAIDTYSRVSFAQIFDPTFSDTDDLEVYMVVALAMLALIEYSG